MRTKYQIAIEDEHGITYHREASYERGAFQGYNGDLYVRFSVLAPEEALRRVAIRPALVREYSFAIPDQEALALLISHAPLLEVGAGSGYWAYELRRLGCDIIATDPAIGTANEYKFTRYWSDVLELSAVEAIAAHPGRALLMVWPAPGPWAAEALRAYQGETFIYIGEEAVTCADRGFFALLEAEEEWCEVAHYNLPRWYNARDRLVVFKRTVPHDKG